MPSSSSAAQTPPPPDESHLDALHLRYLNALGTYQAQTSELAHALSTGFLALARASLVAPPPHGGQYCVELAEQHGDSLRARRGVRIEATAAAEGEEMVVFEECELDAEEERGPEIKDDNGGLRQRRGRPTTEANTTKDPTPTEPKPPSRDTLTLFHPLPPQPLRTAASHFAAAVSTLPVLATTLHAVSRMYSEIAHHKRAVHIYKILLSPPPESWPLPPSPLDAQSGFIHLCTAPQALGVLQRFMANVQEVWVLRVNYADIAADTKWEAVDGDEFPHLYGTLEEPAVDAVGHMQKAGESWEGGDWERVEWTPPHKESGR